MLHFSSFVPANNYLQIIVCACIILFKCVWVQKNNHNNGHAYSSCKHACSRLVWKMADRFPEQSESDFNMKTNNLVDRIIKQLLNLVFCKMLWFFSVLQFSYLTQPLALTNRNYQSPCHWENHDIFLYLGLPNNYCFFLQNQVLLSSNVSDSLD